METIEEIEHNLCLVLYNWITIGVPSTSHEHEYAIKSIYNCLSEDPNFAKSAETIQEYCKHFSFEKCVNVPDISKSTGYIHGYTPWYIGYDIKTLSFFEFIANFDTTSKKFKLKDSIESTNDLYEIFFDTEKYMLKFWSKKQYHMNYLRICMLDEPSGFNEFTALHILNLSSATKVFEHKQQLKLSSVLQEKAQQEHEENLIVRGQFSRKMYPTIEEKFINNFAGQMKNEMSEMRLSIEKIEKALGL